MNLLDSIQYDYHLKGNYARGLSFILFSGYHRAALQAKKKTVLIKTSQSSIHVKRFVEIALKSDISLKIQVTYEIRFPFI